MLLAAIGVFRMPDLFSRMQTSTKASTLGSGFLLLALSLHFAKLSVTARALAGWAFLLLTAPVAAHLVARAAYLMGIPLWEGTLKDELKGQYDPQTGTLKSSREKDEKNE